MDRRSVSNWCSHNDYRHPEIGDVPRHGLEDDLLYGHGEAAGDQDQGHHDDEDHLSAHEVTGEENAVVRVLLVQDNKTHSFRNSSNRLLFLKSYTNAKSFAPYILFTYKKFCIIKTLKIVVALSSGL